MVVSVLPIFTELACANTIQKPNNGDSNSKGSQSFAETREQKFGIADSENGGITVNRIDEYRVTGQPAPSQNVKGTNNMPYSGHFW